MMIDQITRRIIFPLLFAPLAVKGQALPAEDEIWQKFVRWATEISPDEWPANLRGILAKYREKLTKDGIQTVQAEIAIRTIQQRVNGDTAFSTLAYNKAYQSKNPFFSSSPNDFLVRTVKSLQPGRALDLGMGQGRNTIFLAQQGWDVTGLDLAEVGITIAKDRAKELGIKINALVQDVDRFDFGSSVWDLVCTLYFSGYNYVHDIEKRIVKGLKTGGHLIYEVPNASVKGLMDRWTSLELLGLRPIHLEFDTGKADWGQQGFQRILAQKPA